MTIRVLTLLAVTGALAGAGCTMNQASAPGLTGPSTYATNLVVTATPDTVVLNGQQSVVVVEAHDATGGPLANLRVHLGIVSGGVLANCGRLSLTDVTTASDGRAAVIFTAPSVPLPMPECASAAEGITILATPIGTNAQTSTTFSAGINFLTPASTSQATVFAVNFTISPNPGTVGAEIGFSDAGSVSPGQNIVSYQWAFSDGATKGGSSVSHDFGAKGIYTATLTITDDIGRSGFKTRWSRSLISSIRRSRWQIHGLKTCDAGSRRIRRRLRCAARGGMRRAGECQRRWRCCMGLEVHLSYFPRVTLGCALSSSDSSTRRRPNARVLDGNRQPGGDSAG